MQSTPDEVLIGNVTAQIWYTKSRMGWSKTSILKHSEETQFDRMSEEELIRSIAERASRLGIKIDMSIGEQHPHALDRNHRSKRQRRG